MHDGCILFFEVREGVIVLDFLSGSQNLKMANIMSVTVKQKIRFIVIPFNRGLNF